MPIQQMLLGVGGGPTEVTETLSSTSTFNSDWTAPAGVTSVNAVLTGADDIPQSSVGINMKAIAYYTGSAPSASSMVDCIQSWLNTHTSYINSTTSQRTLVGPRENSFTLDTGETTTVYESNHIYGPTRTVTVTGSMSTSFSSPTHNVNGKHFFQYFGGLTGIIAGVAGNDATMFGFTASGASIGGSPSTVTQNNISVTPGQSYSFNSGYVARPGGAYATRNGSIVLTYYV